MRRTDPALRPLYWWLPATIALVGAALNMITVSAYPRGASERYVVSDPDVPRARAVGRTRHPRPAPPEYAEARGGRERLFR
jgi:hypothetical protein